jgi:hypothetical protein
MTIQLSNSLLCIIPNYHPIYFQIRSRAIPSHLFYGVKLVLFLCRTNINCNLLRNMSDLRFHEPWLGRLGYNAISTSTSPPYDMCSVLSKIKKVECQILKKIRKPQ